MTVQRQKGESYGDWLKRNHKRYKKDWEAEKRSKGDWLPADEYEKKTGRPGKKSRF
jgi:hypothetical protein